MIRYHPLLNKWIVTIEMVPYEFDFLDDALAFVCQSGYAS